MSGTAEVTERKAYFDAQGYWVERGLFSQAEMAGVSGTFMRMHASGGVKGHYEYRPEGEPAFEYQIGNAKGTLLALPKGDPLALYPRVIQPHTFMPLAKQYMFEPRLFDAVEDLFGEPALASQSMFYFKPAGARGQAWHQDNFYLRIKPGTCLAAWIAVDPSDEENGGLQVVPGTHRLDILCPEKTADPSLSFTKEMVPPPDGMRAEKLSLAPGDVLFFNGSVIHGSTPNTSKDRMRRSLIYHYAGESCVETSAYNHALMNRRGEPVKRAEAQGGGPCGTEFAGLH